VKRQHLKMPDLTAQCHRSPPAALPRRAQIHEGPRRQASRPL